MLGKKICWMIALSAACCLCVSCDDDSGSKDSAIGCTSADNVCVNANTASVCNASGTMETIDCSGDKPFCRNGECVSESNTKCTKADNKCLDAHTASICGTSGTMETIDCTGDKPICNDGECVPESNTKCTAADNKCLDAHTASICNASGTMETVNCTGDKPICNDGECVSESNTKCTKADNKCLDAHTASICNASGTMETVNCTGDKPICNDGECVPENNTKCTAADNACLDEHTASICGTSGTMETIDCTGDKPICDDGECVPESNTKCTAADNKCLDAHTASICNASGTMETVNCTGDKPDCKDGECVKTSAPQCTSSNNKCASLKTALICNTDTGELETIDCSGETPNCRNGQCVKGDCENDAIRCLNSTLPQKCIDDQWVTQAECGGNTPICKNDIGCSTECDFSGLQCNEASTGTKQCVNGKWQYDFCPSSAPVCVNGECKISEIFWCTFHWLEYNSLDKTATGYGRIWIPNEIDANELKGYMACTSDLSMPVSQWTKIDAVVNPYCSDCGVNTEYMTSVYHSANGYNYCTFIYEYRDQFLACRPQQTGESSPIRLNQTDTLDALYTRYFYQIGECATEGAYTCTNNKRMRCSGGNWIEDKICSDTTPRCDHLTNDCAPACSSGDRFCGSANTATQCQSGEFKEVRCDNYCVNGECVDCMDGDMKCDSNIPMKCENGRWKSLPACTAPKDKCVISLDERCIGECEGNTVECDEETHSLKSCRNGHWEYQSCGGSTPFCYDGDVECTGDCDDELDGDLACNYYSNGTEYCRNGVWIYEDCPFERSYCDPDTITCRDWEAGDPCNPKGFVPFIKDNKVYVCGAYKKYTKNGTKAKGEIVIEPCDGECDSAAYGNGVNVSSARYAHGCSTKGHIDLGFKYMPEGHSNYVTLDYGCCLQCKEDSNGYLKYLMVPATYNYNQSGELVGCTPMN